MARFAVVARKPEGKSGAAGCKSFLDHGRKIICSGDEQHYDYLIKREAFIAQRRVRSEIALALQTKEEGSGKGFWCKHLNRLYGVHAMEVTNSQHVVGKHNAHLETLLRLTADEALFALNHEHRNSLFTLITEPRITVEPKFVGAYSAENYVNVDILSNADHFIPVSGTARRFFVPTVSTDRVGDLEYFAGIDAELNAGGYEALLWHLLHEIDIRDFNVRAVPKTAALREQAAYSRRGSICWSSTRAIQDRSRVRAGTRISPTAAHTEKREGFDYFIDHHSDPELKRLGSLAVKRRLANEWGCRTGKEARKQIGNARYYGVVWPPLAELRAKFVEKFGPQDWLVDMTEWL